MAAVTLLAAPAFAQQAPALYKRLGGCDAIAAKSDDFLGGLSTDPQFTKFFAGHSTESIKRLRLLSSTRSARRRAAPASTSGAT